MSETRLFAVTMPYPVSQNKSLTWNPSIKQFIKTKESHAWYSEAKHNCTVAHGIGSLFPIERVAVHITLCPSERSRSDIDNGIKKILDVMTQEAYHDDRQVRIVHVKFHDLPRGSESWSQAYVWNLDGEYEETMKRFIEGLWRL